MKKKMLGILAVIIAAVSITTGCLVPSTQKPNAVIKTDSGRDYASIDAKSVSFDNEAGPLTMNNQASFDTIVFAGKVENGNVLGGIRAQGSRSFDLTKLPLPQRQGSLLIRVTSFETYSRKKFRVTEEDVIYTGLVVYNLDDPGDRTNLNIFRGVDQTQSSFVYATNDSRYVLELRLGSPTGERIATLPPRLENKKIWITPLADGMPYRFYATYVYIDPRTNEISSIVPDSKRDSDMAYPDSDNSNITPMVFKGPEGGAGVAYNVSFVRLINGSPQGIQFYNAATILPDQKGIRFTASGRQAIYELNSESGEGGQRYTSLILQFTRGEQLTLDAPPPVILKPGYVYDLNVTQDYTYRLEERGKKNRLDDARINLLFGDT
ncbi:MAG: hypothetical protein LBC51_11995 [Treponema sp.]|nr:hypothetical protein [Treponema sp.]